MKVSVIIPVFNADKYIEKSVNSALIQKQCKEIILIEDGSTDDSLKKCQNLALVHDRVKVLCHSNNSNKGTAASRNLGIKSARHPFIAFLDADDYYLSGFFDEAERLFQLHSDANGVFGCIQAFYYDEKARLEHLKRTGTSRTRLNLNYEPILGNLFDLLLQPKTGYFSIIAMVLQKEAVINTGYFDIDLKQSEDTDFIWRLSRFNTFYGINIHKTVAVRGVHSGNRVLHQKERDFYKYLLYKKWINNIGKYKISKETSKMILRKYLVFHPVTRRYENNKPLRISLKLIIVFYLLIKKTFLWNTLLLRK